MKTTITYRFLNSKYILYVLVLLCISVQTLAINKQARIEIDAKRAGIGYTSEDALPRGREFKRLDSTYYVGWMLEGTYKNEHACDYLGYKNASTQLEKAIFLLEKDFKKELKNRTDNVMDYISSSKYQRDYDYTARCLYECYSNMEDGNKVWDLLQRVKKIDLQIEEYVECFNLMAWTVHRNRFYTSAKYPFLKNSIIENELFANELLEQGNRKIKIDAALNKKIFTVDYLKVKEPSVWHYKSMLYAYQLNIQSGEFYYNKMRETPFFPSNNYGTFCSIQCNFKDAENYYGISKKQDYSDKRMKESYYYSTIIDVYKGEPKVAVQEMNDLIKAMGSTPGFGWYNLGLARSLLYDGQTELAKKYLQRAEDFKEIHIGTTLGQSHYDFTTSLLKLVAKNKEIDAALFMNKNWWYSPTSIYNLSLLYAEKKALQFLIINQFAQNPERDRVIYKLFSTESTVSFDEIYQLIEGFSANYFLERFKKELTTDTRINVKRYYKYFIAKLLQKQKKYTEAISYLESAQRDMMIDKKYEKLFIGRTHEAQAQCYKELNKPAEMQTAILNAFNIYPQLIPYSNITFPIQLIMNSNTTEEQTFLKEFKKSKLALSTSTSSSKIPKVKITLGKKGNNKMITYSTSIQGKEMYTPTTLAYTSAEDISKKTLFYIFNIGNGEEISKQKK